MQPDHAPVLVGVAQLVQRDAELDAALEPLEMLEQMARGAAADAGADRTLEAVDTLGLVDVAAWRPGNAPRLVAEQIGARPTAEYLTAVGGETPLVLVERLAARIARGESRVALALGCNNVKTLRRAMQAKAKLDWKKGGEGEPELIGRTKPGSSEREKSYGLATPTDVYPIFENALRAHRGLDLETHRQRMGAMMSRFSAVAAKNPYAWFPVERSPEEITTVTPTNRMVAFPYPKYLNAVIETDQAAGVLLMSAEAARSFGVPEDRRVYCYGGGRCEERAWFASERPSFASCPALATAAEGALERAGVGVDELRHIDFYSCFPVAVEMACEMLGLDELDERGLTVTGGLPYAGGPANNYTLHSLAAMVERLRAQPGAGLVTGNGWYLTKHSALVCASAPPEPEILERAFAQRTEPAPDERGPVEVCDSADDGAEIVTYTVVYDREGAPARGIVVGRSDAGQRFLANTPDDRSLLESLVTAEGVGVRGRVHHRAGRNVFTPR